MSSYDWLRLWHGTPVDGKLSMIAKQAGARRCEMTAFWECLLDYASQHSERGTVGSIDLEVIAFQQEIDYEVLLAMWAGLERRGVIAEGKLVNWNERQPKREDGSAERAKAWRERKQAERVPNDSTRTQPNATERTQTLENAPDRDIDIDQDLNVIITPISAHAEAANVAAPQTKTVTTSRSKPKPVLSDAATAAFDNFWSLYPRRDGARVGRRNAELEFAKLEPPEWPDVLRGVERYAKLCDPARPNPRPPKDAERFLRDRVWRDMLEAVEPPRSAGSVLNGRAPSPGVEETRRKLESLKPDWMRNGATPNQSAS